MTSESDRLNPKRRVFESHSGFRLRPQVFLVLINVIKSDDLTVYFQNCEIFFKNRIRKKFFLMISFNRKL